MPSEWIAVCGEEGDNPIEIETEDDGTLLLEELVAHFPGTTTLKYKNRETNSYRSVKCAGGVLKPPGGAWDQSLYICVNPSKPEASSRKRTAEQSFTGDNEGTTDLKRSMPDIDPTKCYDLIILGLKPSTSSSQIQKYFETYGDVEMVQTKNARDKNVAFAFIRFKDKEVERKVLREKHQIDDRECTVRIPDSQLGDKYQRKIYVSYHDQSITSDDLRDHFDKFGDVVEVYIPNPWRHFCMITFHDARIAQSLVGKEHILKGASLLIKTAGNLKGRKNDMNEEQQGMNQMGNFGNMGGWNQGMTPWQGNGGAMGGMGNQSMMGQMGSMGATGMMMRNHLMGGMGGNMGGDMGGNMGGNMGNMGMSGSPNMKGGSSWSGQQGMTGFGSSGQTGQQMQGGYGQSSGGMKPRWN